MKEYSTWWIELHSEYKAKLCYKYFPPLGFNYNWLYDFQIDYIHQKEFNL